MEEDLTGWLTDDGPLAALVGARVNWLLRPQGEGLGAVTLTKTDAHRLDGSQDGHGVVWESFIQADSWGATALQAKQVARAVRARTDALSRTTHGSTLFIRAFLEVEADMGADRLESDDIVFRTRQLLKVHHQPAP